MVKKMPSKSSKSSGGVRQAGPPPHPFSGSIQLSKQEATYEFWSFRFTSSKVLKFDDILSWANQHDKYRFQLEQGEGGVQHYQGTIHCKPKKRRSQLRKNAMEAFPELEFPNKDYLEKSKSSAADRYVMKQDTRVNGPWEKNMPPEKINMDCTDEDVMKYDDLPKWSQECIDMLKDGLPNKKDRSIYWYWSKEGMRFKTETARYLVYHHQAIILHGNAKHILATAYKNPAPIYIMIDPRCAKASGISYKSLELLKDALYMSGFGVDATGMVNRKKGWVLVMCNYECDNDPKKMSVDRWIKKNVDDVPTEVEQVTDNTWDGSGQFGALDGYFGST